MIETAHEVMSKKLITIRMEDSVRTAFEVMQDKKIRHLPVVDSMGEIVGILSDRDLQRAMKPQKGGEFEAIEFNPAHQAQDYMSWPVRSIREDVSIHDVTARILNEKVSALMVTSTGNHARIKGIITTDDLLRVLLKLLEKEPESGRLSLGSILDSISESNRIWA